MEKKNDSTILLLLAAGFGVYWLTRKKPIVTAMPVEEKKSVQPVVEQPIYVAPIMDQPIVPPEIKKNIDLVQDAEYTPVMDMFNTVWQPNYDNKTPMEPVFNMNIEPVE